MAARFTTVTYADIQIGDSPDLAACDVIDRVVKGECRVTLRHDGVEVEVSTMLLADLLLAHTRWIKERAKR